MDPTSDLCKKLVDAMRNSLLQRMPADQRADLRWRSLHELQRIVGNWESRLIPCRPRRVHLAEGFDVHTSAVPQAHELAAIVAKIEEGADLAPHLSEKVTSAHSAATDARGKPVKMHRRRDLDLMLAAWGIHHLHLSGQIELNGFVTRGADLLFAAFKPNDAYLIGVYDHDSWARKEVLDVIVNNWPDAGIASVSQSGVTASVDLTDEEILDLRKAGGNAIVNVNGRAVIPGLMGLGGTSILITDHANETAHAIYRLDQQVIQHGVGVLDDHCDAPGFLTQADWVPALHTVAYGTLAGFEDSNAANNERFVPVAWLLPPR